MLPVLHIDEQGRLTCTLMGETLCVEAWGEHALRVRSVRHGCELDAEPGALLDNPEGRASITLDGETAVIENGRIRVIITTGGKLVFYNHKGEKLLEEYARNRRDLHRQDWRIAGESCHQS